MRTHTRRPYAFHLQLEVACAFPAYLRPAVFLAARAALDALPANLLREKLQPGLPYSLSLSIVTPAAIRKLNRAWRAKDKPTDVLSFSRLEGPRTPIPDIGDVLICWEVAKKQTTDFGTTRRGELQRLVVHGILHLFGYDHETGEREARRMFRLQERILASLK